MRSKKDSSRNPVIIQVNKKDIVQCNTSLIVNILDSFMPELTDRNRNRVRIEVLGYTSDKRELFDIPEVRKYFQNLFDEVDGAFYWLDPNSYMLLFWGLMLLTPYRENGQVGLLSEDLQKYLYWGYLKLNAFCEANNLSADESTNAISKAIRNH